MLIMKMLIGILFGIICQILPFSIPGVFWGDFNCILNITEACGGREFWTPAMQRFKDCVNSAGITDLRSVGDSFTWYNKNPAAPIFKRLDRVFVNSVWLQNFPEAQVNVLNRGYYGSQFPHC